MKKTNVHVGDILTWTYDGRFSNPKDYVIEVVKEPEWEGTWWSVYCKVISLPEDYPKDAVKKFGKFGLECFSVIGHVDDFEENV